MRRGPGVDGADRSLRTVDVSSDIPAAASHSLESRYCIVASVYTSWNVWLINEHISSAFRWNTSVESVAK